MHVEMKSAEVDNVEVHSDWAIQNFGCAPINQPAGNLNVGQPNPSETVARTGPGEYEVTITEDRYLPDACKWSREGTQFNFMRNGEIFATYLVSRNDVLTRKEHHITCTPRTRWFGTCGLIENMRPAEFPRSGLFNGLIEFSQ